VEPVEPVEPVELAAKTPIFFAMEALHHCVIVWYHESLGKSQALPL